jgi:hypothetical protein
MKSNVVLRKLSGAFTALERQGYWTLEGDICCQSCGLAMIPDDKAGTYCFFHVQDEDALFETGDCYLSWDGDAALIISELEAAGLRVEWNGDARTRIRVSDNPAVRCPPGRAGKRNLGTSATMMREINKALRAGVAAAENDVCPGCLQKPCIGAGCALGAAMKV